MPLFIYPSDSRWATETLQCLRDSYPPGCPFCYRLRASLPLRWPVGCYGNENNDNNMVTTRSRCRNMGETRSINMKFRRSSYDFILKNCQNPHRKGNTYRQTPTQARVYLFTRIGKYWFFSRILARCYQLITIA